MSENLYPTESEKSILGALIQYPESYIEVQPYIKSSDFSRINSSIFSVIAQEIENGGIPSPVILTARLNSLGIKFPGIDTIDYLHSLKYASSDRNQISSIAKEIKKYSIVRTVYENAELLKRKVVELKDRPASELLEAIDILLKDSTAIFDSNDSEAVNLYEKLADFVEEKGNNPTKEVGYKMPFELWNDYYGGLRKGGIYFTASRSGQGKSTFLSYIADQVANVCNPGLNIKVLFLDTEMDEDDQMTRLAAARTKCPYYLIDTGQWRQSEEWCLKIREQLKVIRNENRNLWFKQVSSYGIDSLTNFIKRWYYKNVGKDGNGLVIYDYLKVLAGDGDSRQPEWAIALQKMQKLKDLALHLKLPIFTALQVNRSGTTTNKTSSEVVDDETVLSISGRIDWLVNYGGILRRKTHDEIAEDGNEFGTHKLITLKSRYQGRISSGHQDLVKVFENGKTRYKQNYLCFNLDNFDVEERGDFRRIAELKGITKLKKSPSNPNASL